MNITPINQIRYTSQKNKKNQNKKEPSSNVNFTAKPKGKFVGAKLALALLAAVSLHRCSHNTGTEAKTCDHAICSISNYYEYAKEIPETYTIQEGDTLWNIVQECFDYTLDDKQSAELVGIIVEHNNIDDVRTLQINQIIDLSCIKDLQCGDLPQSDEPETHEAEAKKEFYIIQENDSLWTIVDSYYQGKASVNEINKGVQILIEANNIKDPTKLKIGDKIDVTPLIESDSRLKASITHSEKMTENQVLITKDSEGNFKFNFSQNLTPEQEYDLSLFKKNFEKNKDRYMAVEEKTGVPAILIAAIHWRESAGNFETYLHNGEKLGQVTTKVPKGIYMENWEDAAVDALNRQLEKVKNFALNPPEYSSGYSFDWENAIPDPNDINTWFNFAEVYNGLGYDMKDIASPYVWSGTNIYETGKYIADGSYDPQVKDRQIGVAIMVQELLS